MPCDWGSRAGARRPGVCLPLRGCGTGWALCPRLRREGFSEAPVSLAFWDSICGVGRGLRELEPGLCPL